MSHKIPFWKKLLSWFYPLTIERIESNVSHVLEVNLQYGMLVIDSPHANYCYGSVQSIFQETIQSLNLSNSKEYKVLILGFGGGNIADILRNQFHINCHITGVELDKQIIALSKKYFNPNTYKNTDIFIEDAQTFIENNKEKYDLIFVDLFVDTIVPKKFQEIIFLKLLRNALKEDAILCMNSMFKTDNLKTNWPKVFLKNKGLAIQENFVFIHKNI